ncbi:unnamed protein product [Lactuca virosa]|uniref:Uncharacterized protein n=1 Tax=Lactuca virosa TaxID=75947 RepID=A0AAU9PX30_9ASTR|nr:unnamed protein product [Lactuca virosa]
MKVNEFATSLVGSPLTEVVEGATNLHVDHGVGDQFLSMAMNETSGSGAVILLPSTRSSSIMLLLQFCCFAIDVFRGVPEQQSASFRFSISVASVTRYFR